jgi:Na+-translocating ferredoxin:NAD+ oxidoreductase subunit C
MTTWSDWWAWLQGKSVFPRGIHPDDAKELSANCPVIELPAPARVTVPLQQHAGAPAELGVRPRQWIAAGSLLGESGEARISARVHSPIEGVVHPLLGVTLPTGAHGFAVPIHREPPSRRGSQDEANAPTHSSISPVTTWSLFSEEDWDIGGEHHWFPNEIVEAVHAAGIVGQGGAVFPTHLKLISQPLRPIHAVLLNGCECEPYLTSDYRLMVEGSGAILSGLRLAMRATGAARGVVAIEDNKPQALATMREQISPYPDLQLVPCQTKYPMGGERQLIPAIFGHVVPTGGYPIDVGVVVINVATAAAIAAAVYCGYPLTHRVVTVSGQGVREPKNLFAPIGISLGELLEACGGLTDDARRVLAGGPLMGYSVTDLNTPLTKGIGGITVLTSGDLEGAEPTACIRCGRCVDVCPLGLAPTKIGLASRDSRWDVARRYDIAACCECGCCGYVCPARIPLVQYIRTGKKVVAPDLESNRSTLPARAGSAEATFLG